MTKTITITGHRPHKLDMDYDMTGVKSKTLFVMLDTLFKSEQATHIIVGAALGTDTIAALVALNNFLKLTLAIPFKGQERQWPQKAQDLYRVLISKAQEVVYVSEGPPPSKPWEISDCFQKRNIWMVDQLTPGRDKVISVWDGSAGGTKNCIAYAKSKQPPIDVINIDPATMIVSNL